MRHSLKNGLLFLLILTALNGACPALHAQADAWKTFGNTADGFKALFPAEPEVTKNSVAVGGDTYELHSYVAESGDTALYIGVCDYGPKGATAEPDGLLSSAKNGAVEHMSAHILTEKKITLETNHGVAFEAESDKLHFSARMYIAGGVLYQTMVATPLGSKFADAPRFLDSFQITQRPASAVVTSPGAATPAPEWKPYSYPADGFSAAFPAQPKLEKQNVATAAGNVDFHTYTSEDNATALIVGVCNFGESAAGKDPETILQGGKNGAIQNIKGHLVSEKPITMGQHRGLAFEAENESAHVSARIYLVGTTLYQVIIALPIHATYADSDRFLNSLQLLPPQTP